MTTATAMKNAATSLPNASRLRTAVKRSPAGERPDGVVSDGLGARGRGRGARRRLDRRGLVERDQRDAVEVAVDRRALEPRVAAAHAADVAADGARLLEVRDLAEVGAAGVDARSDAPLPSSSTAPPKQVERGEIV